MSLQAETREIYSCSFVWRLTLSFMTPGVQFDKPTGMVNEQTTPVSLPPRLMCLCRIMAVYSTVAKGLCGAPLKGP